MSLFLALLDVLAGRRTGDEVDVVAAAMEANGATNSEMYRRAKALANGQADPMPTSFPAAPVSISAA